MDENGMDISMLLFTSVGLINKIPWRAPKIWMLHTSCDNHSVSNMSESQTCLRLCASESHSTAHTWLQSVISFYELEKCKSRLAFLLWDFYHKLRFSRCFWQGQSQRSAKTTENSKNAKNFISLYKVGPLWLKFAVNSYEWLWKHQWKLHGKIQHTSSSLIVTVDGKLDQLDHQRLSLLQGIIDSISKLALLLCIISTDDCAQRIQKRGQFTDFTLTYRGKSFRCTGS
jgi:hypothetical protein